MFRIVAAGAKGANRSPVLATLEVRTKGIKGKENSEDREGIGGALWLTFNARRDLLLFLCPNLLLVRQLYIPAASFAFGGRRSSHVYLISTWSTARYIVLLYFTDLA